MSKAAILVLADTETHADLGRVVNALVATKEFKDAGDDVRLIFDGAGTQWPGVLSDPEHQAGLAGQLRWRGSAAGAPDRAGLPRGRAAAVLADLP